MNAAEKNRRRIAAMRSNETLPDQTTGRVSARSINRGESNGRAKLSVDSVREIREATGRNADIAKQFGVSESTVSQIKRGVIWSHV